MAGAEATNVDALRRTLKRLIDQERSQQSKAGMEKRRHKRHYYTIEARAKYVKRYDQLSMAPDEFKILTKDISQSGLSFIHDHEMYAGEIVQVDIQVNKIHREFTLLVVRCRRAGLKVFDVAGQFINPEEATAAQAQTAGAQMKPAAK